MTTKIQKKDLATTLAASLTQAHKLATKAAEKARGNIGDALEKAANVGLLVEEAKSIHRGNLNQWLRKSVPGLMVEQAEAYLGIYRVRQKRQDKRIDHRQLKLIGLVGGEDLEIEGGSSTAQRADHGRWVKWAGHVEHALRDILETKPIEKWEDYERNALADQLEPLVRIWESAKGISAQYNRKDKITPKG